MKKLIALTFDDGPSSTTYDVLRILDKHRVRATFFVVGDHIAKNRDTIRQAVSLGCDIENHSKTHPFMSKFLPPQIKAEIDFTNDAVEKITRRRPKFFRPPYIDVSATMYDEIDEIFICGYVPEDYKDEVNEAEIVKRVMENAKDGLIILLHDYPGMGKTVKAVDKIIPALLAQDYQFVTVDELFTAKYTTPRRHVMYSEVNH
jgi:peptidoglycan/xylan/chitin deacetylase (PgdA/CDA1 family)